MIKIALSMIVKDTESLDNIVRCINSVVEHVDGIFLTLNGPTEKETPEAKLLKKELGKRYIGAHIDYIKWDKNFAQARNHSLGEVPEEFTWVLWLDVDDVLRGAQNMREAITRAEKVNARAIFFNYIYRADFNPDGSIKAVLIEHLRERLFKNDGSYHWVGALHETAIPKVEVNQTDSDLCDVLHLSGEERMQKAIQRNMEILEAQLERESPRKDPRTMYYLAKTYFDLQTDEYHRKAEDLIHKYLNGSEDSTPSGWAEERAQAWDYLAEIYRKRGEYNKAIKASLNAIAEGPQFPMFYISMALHYIFLKDWDKATSWVKLSQALPYPKTTLALNPRDMKARVLEVLYHIYMSTNKIDEALETARRILEVFPEDPIMTDRLQTTKEIQQRNRVAHNVIGLAQFLMERGQPERAAALMKAIPREIEQEPIMVNMMNDLTPPRVWESSEIAILCGKGFEKWSPKNLEGGIGGSEEAVIYLSKELTKLGWKVTVFADPQEDKGIYDGVTYLPYQYLNLNDTFNVFIAWRNIAFLDNKIKARKAYLWLHDIQNSLEYRPERVEKINKIFALSKWHRNNMPNVHDDKFMLTANGLNLGHFELLDAENIERNPHRVIWTSSYDRGLEHLLNIWPQVLEEVPDAELHIFYGWNLFESFYHNNPERMAWKAKVDKLMGQKGVFHHGRVGQLEVLRETYKSGVWAYPTHFGEISCITAMKCQAAGAIPVTTDYAALAETVRHGVKVGLDNDPDAIRTVEKQKEFAQNLVKILKDEKVQEEIREKMMSDARNTFNWAKIATQWNDEFKVDDVLEAAKVLLEVNSKSSKYLPVQVQEKLEHEQTY